ncbi:MAG: hypothetical protein C0514_03375 [Candidatus Puniceispirillum sp.]|nr:hypothetical protein [Candidatus Puniceispirillum sp.]
MTRFLMILALLPVIFLWGCASPGTPEGATKCHPTFAKRAYNRPYKINGTWYYPQGHYEYNETGVASYYGGSDIFHGRPTSNGEKFDKNKVSAAHKTLPIPCVVRVTNLKNGRSITMPVNDRGPFKDSRIIDVSQKAAQLLGFHRDGLAQVCVETCVPESVDLAHAKAKGKKTTDHHQICETVCTDVKVSPKRRVAPAKKVPVPPTYKIVREKEGYFVSVGAPGRLDQVHAKADTYMKKLPHVGVSLAPHRGVGPKQFRLLLGPVSSSQDAHNLLKMLDPHKTPSAG